MFSRSGDILETDMLCKGLSSTVVCVYWKDPTTVEESPLHSISVSNISPDLENIKQPQDDDVKDDASF
jgi:hypothetical protein